MRLQSNFELGTPAAITPTSGKQHHWPAKLQALVLLQRHGDDSCCCHVLFSPAIAYLIAKARYVVPYDPVGRRRYSEGLGQPTKSQSELLIEYKAFNHDQSRDSEAEYERLRSLARQEHDKRASCFDKVRSASAYMNARLN